MSGSYHSLPPPTTPTTTTPNLLQISSSLHTIILQLESLHDNLLSDKVNNAVGNDDEHSNSSPSSSLALSTSSSLALSSYTTNIQLLAKQTRQHCSQLEVQQLQLDQKQQYNEQQLDIEQQQFIHQQVMIQQQLTADKQQFELTKQKFEITSLLVNEHQAIAPLTILPQLSTVATLLSSTITPQPPTTQLTQLINIVDDDQQQDNQTKLLCPQCKDYTTNQQQLQDDIEQFNNIQYEFDQSVKFTNKQLDERTIKVIKKESQLNKLESKLLTAGNQLQQQQSQLTTDIEQFNNIQYEFDQSVEFTNKQLDERTVTVIKKELQLNKLESKLLTAGNQLQQQQLQVTIDQQQLQQQFNLLPIQSQLIKTIQNVATTTRVAQYTRLIQNYRKSNRALHCCAVNDNSFIENVDPDEVFWVKINFINFNKFIIYPFTSEDGYLLHASQMVFAGPHFASDRAIHNIPNDITVPYYISSKGICNGDYVQYSGPGSAVNGQLLQFSYIFKYDPSLPIQTTTSPHDRFTRSKEDCKEQCDKSIMDDYQLYHDPVDKVYKYRYEVDIKWDDIA